MNRFSAVLAAVIALPALSAQAASPPAPSPLIGRWAIDVATLPIPPESRPKAVTMEFNDAGNGSWKTDVEITDPKGNVMDAHSTLATDGTPGPVNGEYGANEAALKMPTRDVLVLQLVDHGTPASTRIYTVSADGKVLTETKAFFSREGTPILQTSTFQRMP